MPFNIVEALKLLTLELPDRYQELSVQQCHNSFIYFPKLPLEIRLAIWRLLFPKARKVLINVQYKSNKNQQDRGSPLPIGLRVNRESRFETLKHYTVFHQDPLVFHPKAFVELVEHPNPTCVNPFKDTIRFSQNNLYSDDFPELIYDMRTRSSRVFNTIQKLEIMDLSWHETNVDVISRLWAPHVQALTSFRNLSEICFTYSEEYYRLRFWRNRWSAEVLSFYQDCFQKEKKYYPALKVPTISIMPETQRHLLDKGMVAGKRK